MHCRFCKNPLENIFIDLGSSPPSNSFLTERELDEPEISYPLKLFVCGNCFLVQIAEYKKSEEIFSDKYLYFSSYSTTWLEHARNYVDMISERLSLGPGSFVIEIASNDGYLLQYFKERRVPCLGIEPAAATADVARKKGIEVIGDFFGTRLAKELVRKVGQADLIVGNNVLAHVPDINDFVQGLKILLQSDGVITLEFPHLMQLVEKNQFDTIYHEHFSYFSLTTVKRILAHHGLTLFDVEALTTHGGSLRIYVSHEEDRSKGESPKVREMLDREDQSRMGDLEYYRGFQEKADRIKHDLLSFLLKQKTEGRPVAAYGAAAKGNTLLNYCGIKRDMIRFAADRSPHKQGMYLPGSHIPVLPPASLRRHQPAFVLILPWNIKDEIMAQLNFIREWGGKFLLPVPEVSIL